MPRLIWVFAGRIHILLVLSCRGSFSLFVRYKVTSSFIYLQIFKPTEFPNKASWLIYWVEVWRPTQEYSDHVEGGHFHSPTVPGQAWLSPSKGLPVFIAVTDNCNDWISSWERMDAKIFSWQVSKKDMWSRLLTTPYFMPILCHLSILTYYPWTSWSWYTYIVLGLKTIFHGI